MTDESGEDNIKAAREYEVKYDEAYRLLYLDQESMEALPAVLTSRRRDRMSEKTWNSPRQVVLDRKKEEFKSKEPARGMMKIQQMFGGGVSTHKQVRQND